MTNKTATDRLYERLKNLENVFEKLSEQQESIRELVKILQDRLDLRSDDGR